MPCLSIRGSGRGSRCRSEKSDAAIGRSLYSSSNCWRVTLAPGASGSTVSKVSLPLDLAASSCPTFWNVPGASLSCSGSAGRGGEERQLGRAGQRCEQVVDALEAGGGLLDRPRQVILEVAEAHVGRAVAVRLHFDQVAEVEHLALVAVAHQDVEVGVDHRRLVAAGHLEGRRLDAVRLVRLGLRCPGWSSGRPPRRSPCRARRSRTRGAGRPAAARAARAADASSR